MDDATPLTRFTARINNTDMEPFLGERELLDRVLFPLKRTVVDHMDLLIKGEVNPADAQMIMELDND